MLIYIHPAHNFEYFLPHEQLRSSSVLSLPSQSFSPPFLFARLHSRVSKLSWTCFDPPFINKLIRLANNQTRQIPVSHQSPYQVHLDPLVESRCPHHLHARYKCQHNPPTHSTQADRTSTWRSLNPNLNRLPRLAVQLLKERCRCTVGHEQVGWIYFFDFWSLLPCRRLDHT